MTRYSDFDIGFSKHPVTSKLVRKLDAEAVKQSLRNLLLTQRYERPFQPNLHGGITDLLFEPVNPITSSNLEFQIETLIRNHEPRIEVDDITIDGRPDRNSYEVTIVFSLINTTEEITFQTALETLR